MNFPKLLRWTLQIMVFLDLLDMSLQHALNKTPLNIIRNRRNQLPDEQLLYTTSELFPRQISVFNSTAQMGLVVDSLGERVAILNGETGTGVVIDKPLRMGVKVQRGGWSNYRQSLQDYLKECNVTQLMLDNSDYSFQIDGSYNEASQFIEQNSVHFGDDFLSRTVAAGGDAASLALDLFGLVTHPMKNVLGPVLDVTAQGWVVFRGGFMALLNIFKWMGKLVASIAGGVLRLVSKVVRFPLTLIITALDGARAFFYMLRELTINFDLIQLLQTVLTIPAHIALFIAGLGGEVARGITGVFTIVAKVFQFSSTSITLAIQGISNIIMKFFGRKRPNYQEVQSSANELLTIANDQERRFSNKMPEFKDFVGAVAGQSSYDINGVGVNSMVKLLTDTTHSAKNTMVGMFNMLNPIIPFQTAVPQLLVSMVKMLNTTKGPSYLEEVIPELSGLSSKSLEGVTENIAGALLTSSPIGASLGDLKSLPAPSLLKQLPVVSVLYRELDEEVLKYDKNCSLDCLLEANNEAASELVEFTTKALELPIL